MSVLRITVLITICLASAYGAPSPTKAPTKKPTPKPSIRIIPMPTVEATPKPAVNPTEKPTVTTTLSSKPTEKPTQIIPNPTPKPAASPTEKPTVTTALSSKPTEKPTQSITNPTPKPATSPTEKPTATTNLSSKPTEKPTEKPAQSNPNPTPKPTTSPTEKPVGTVSSKPTQVDRLPMLQDEVEKTLQDRPALGQLPDTKIELARYFDRDVNVRYDEKTGALVIESKLTLEPLAEAPSIPGNMLNYRLLEDPSFVEQFMKSEFEGSVPDHLDFSVKPNFVKDDTSINIAQGNDIANDVFGADDRRIFRDHHYPLSTVGRVENERGTCTGTMVGRRLMLTAGHCVNWLPNNGIGWLKFTPSYYDGEAPFGVAWATNIIYWEKPDASDGLTDHETAFDYVIAVLDRNMGDLTGYTGYQTYSSQWNNLRAWQNIGYPGPLTSAQRPVISSGGSITSVQSEFSFSTGRFGYVLGTYIDTERGHSGGPLWGWWAGESYPRVVGDISTSPNTPGPTTSGDNEAGGGPALSALIGWARTQYP